MICQTHKQTATERVCGLNVQAVWGVRAEQGRHLLTLNIACMLVTRDTSQSSTSLLNLCAPSNMLDIVTTLETFQLWRDRLNEFAHCNRGVSIVSGGAAHRVAGRPARDARLRWAMDVPGTYFPSR